MDVFKEIVLEPIINSINECSDRNAFHINNKYFSYKELGRAISKIRTAIQEADIVGENIGFMANDDLETYATMIAIWLEGYAYVPIHPNHPVERGKEIINEAEIGVFIDSSDQITYDTVRNILTKDLVFKSSNLKPNTVEDKELAYVLFTSGSTGKPKGVPITRGNLAAFTKAFEAIGLQVDENDRCLQYFDLTFDISIQSFLVPLRKGASIYTIPHNVIKPLYAYELLEDYQLTFGATPPSMIRYLRPYFEEIDLPYFKTVVLCAEASAVELVDKWKDCVPNARILDLYGPTEATIYCTYSEFHRNKPNKELNGMMSIGKPMEGVTAVIIDTKGNILPKNKKGELCISGDIVTRGYWKNPQKNEEAFFSKMINGEMLRFYRTGDYCYIDDDDELRLSGRLDYQVKIQGYRIELGEIEAHARDFIDGQNAVAVTNANASGETEITLFIEGSNEEESKLVRYLQSKMPSYMIPAKIIRIKEFPINTNGKVDRIRLKKNIVMENNICRLIFSCLEVHNASVSEDCAVEISKETLLYGSDSGLGSMGLANLLISIENKINARYNINIDLVNENMFNQPHNPYLNVESLAAYIDRLLEKADKR